MVKVSARFLTTVMDTALLPPPGIPEVALVGRSNVGKSSLLNSLLGSGLARVSNTPGRTRGINLFEVRFLPSDRPGPDLRVADLPGYGYASGPRRESHAWRALMDGYLRQRPGPLLCLVLVDANLPPQDLDLQALAWLADAGRNPVVVACKVDRIARTRRAVVLRELSRGLGAGLMPFSARTAEGRDELWDRIRRGVS